MEQETGWLRQDFLSEDEARHAHAHALGVPFISLAAADIEKAALALIPEPISRAHSVVAYKQSSAGVEVALLDLADLSALEPLNLKLKILPRLTSRDSMKRALLIYQKYLKEKFGEDIAQAARSGLHQKLVDTLLRHALLLRASVIHLEPFEKNLQVRYRIGGVLHDAMTLPLSAGRGIMRRLKELARVPLEHALPQHGRFKIEKPVRPGHPGGEQEHIAVCLSTAPTLFGEKATLHVVPAGAGRAGFTLLSLGFHGAALDDMYAALSAPSGLIVVCGPKGSGVTTTLYTFLDLLAAPECAVATVEGKITHRLPHAAQTVADPAAGLTIAHALRAALKQDPDVVMVDDISEGDAAVLAVSAAARGVLVLAGLRAPNAALGVEKLLTLGAAPTALASSLRAAVGIRLVRKLCTKNREEQRLSRTETSALEARANFARVLAALKDERMAPKSLAWKEVFFSRARACPECKNGPDATVGTGYLGRVGLQEVLLNSSEIKELIVKGAEGMPALRNLGTAGLSLAEDGIFKAAQGLTSIEEVMTVAGIPAK